MSKTQAKPPAHIGFVKVALPFPAAVPISNVVVPASEPDPDVKVTTKGKLAGELIAKGIEDVRKKLN